MHEDEPEFEKTGWSRVDFSRPGLDTVQSALEAAGHSVETLDLAVLEPAFRAYCHLPQYNGSYRTYGGQMEYCFLEKALEHFVSIVLVRPRRGQVGLDVGSCMSVVPDILRSVYQVDCFEQDLEYPSGIHNWKIGSNASEIPLADGQIDFSTLHCTFEHFEGNSDTGFVRESARILKPGGRVVILPLYVNPNYCNVTGEPESKRGSITFDQGASYYCEIPEWRNRFGRHYSPDALVRRVLVPARHAGLTPRIYRTVGKEVVHKDLWLNWILVLEKPDSSSQTSASG